MVKSWKVGTNWNAVFANLPTLVLLSLASIWDPPSPGTRITGWSLGLSETIL